MTTRAGRHKSTDKTYPQNFTKNIKQRKDEKQSNSPRGRCSPKTQGDDEVMGTDDGADVTGAVVPEYEEIVTDE